MFEKKNFTEKTGNFTDAENKKIVDTEKVMNNDTHSSTQQSSRQFSETTYADMSQTVNISGGSSAIMPDQNVMFAQKELSVASQPVTQPIGASFTPDNVFSDSSINRLELNFQQNQTSFTEQNHMQFNSNARVAFSDNVGKQFSGEGKAHFSGANMPEISNSGNNEMPSVTSKDNFNVPDSKFKNTEIDTFKSHETSFDAKHLDHIKNVPKMDKVAYDSNPALGHVTSTSAIYHKDVKIEFGENSVQKGDRIVMKKGPSVKAHIRFNGKENRTFTDHASKFMDTVNDLQKDNEAAASNADDYIATVIDAAVAKEMRTVQDYKAIEKEAKRDIKAADKAEKLENRSIKKAEKFKDKAEVRFKIEASELKKASEIMKEIPSEENINDYKQAKERYSKAKDKFKDSAEKFVNAKSTAEFKRNNVSIEIDRSQERFLKEDKRGWKSEKDIKREQKVIKKEQKEEIRAREKEKKEGREEKASHERISRFHERSSEFADSEKYFGSRDKRFEKQKESRFVDAPVTTLAVKKDTSLEVKESKSEDKKAKDAGKTGKTTIDKRFADEKDSSIKINREQRKELDKAKQKAAKKEKNKALAKAGAVSAVSKMFRSKAAIQNDIMREENADDLIASGKSSVVSAMLKKINPKDILMEKLKQALRKMLLKLIPLLLVVCLSFVVASIPIITVGCIAAQSDSGDNTYDPSSPNAFTGGDGKEFSSLSSDKIDTIIKKVYKNYPEMDSKHEKALRYALSKVGCPYNQAYHSRCDVDIFDCSSLTYRSYKEIGVNISYHGASSAAEEARGLIADGKSVSGDYEPGDLIFWGGSANGRYLGIYHTAIYIGNGKMVEARGTKWGVVYCDVRNTGSIVAVCRPL